MARNKAQIVDDDRREGRRLAENFNHGAEPPATAVPMALQKEEVCVGYTEVEMSQWQEGDGEYVHKSGGYITFPGMMIAGTVNAIGNAFRRAAAGRSAAAQWRLIDGGVLYMTSSRIAIHGERRWTEIWFTDIRMSDYEPGYLILEIVNSPRVMLKVQKTDYWFVMLQKLAYGVTFLPPEPDDEKLIAAQSPIRETLSSLPESRSDAPLIIPQLVGRWMGLEDQRTLVLTDTAEFRLTLADLTEQSGTCELRGEKLTLTSATGAVSVFRWSLRNDRLFLFRRDRSVSRYARSVPDAAEQSEYDEAGSPRQRTTTDSVQE